MVIIFRLVLVKPGRNFELCGEEAIWELYSLSSSSPRQEKGHQGYPKIIAK
jgi:hypothetical protein